MEKDLPGETLNELKRSKNALKEIIEAFSDQDSIVDVGSHVIVPKEDFESLKENKEPLYRKFR
jgi:PHD/YefM family antitoxin component YafN of YafNO toxin-antitoxin module